MTPKRTRSVQKRKRQAGQNPSLQTPDPARFNKPTRLVYPIATSTKLDGKAERKTWAFVQLGGDEHRRVWEWERALEEAPLKTDEDVIQFIHLRNGLARARNDIALRSSHYIKHLTPRKRALLKRLAENKILAETPLSSVRLGKNVRLLERGNYWQLNESILRGERGGGIVIPANQRRGVIQQVGAILTRMHAGNITHGHTHTKNFVINKQGQVKLIDSSKAKMWKRPPKNKHEFLQRFAKELWDSAISVSPLRAPENHEDNLVPFALEIIESWLAMHARKMNTFGTTPKDVDAYVLLEWKRSPKRRRP